MNNTCNEPIKGNNKPQKKKSILNLPLHDKQQCGLITLGKLVECELLQVTKCN